MLNMPKIKARVAAGMSRLLRYKASMKRTTKNTQILPILYLQLGLGDQNLLIAFTHTYILRCKGEISLGSMR